jgi:hypothetical protein
LATWPAIGTPPAVNGALSIKPKTLPKQKHYSASQHTQIALEMHKEEKTVNKSPAQIYTVKDQAVLSTAFIINLQVDRYRQ